MTRRRTRSSRSSTTTRPTGPPGWRNTPAWGDHVVALQLKLTNAWTHWGSRDNKLVLQEEFAEHIEDGLSEIVSPAGADLLEIVQTIKGATNATWSSGKRLANGQVQFGYVEETTAKAAASGQFEIPETFVLGIAPFDGEDPQGLRARLRYRAPRDGKLQIGYKLDRPEELLARSMTAITERLKTEQQWQVFTGARRS